MLFRSNDGAPPYKSNFFDRVEAIQSESDPANYYTGLNIWYPAWMMYDLRNPNTGKVTDKLPSRGEFHQNDQAFWAGTTQLVNYPSPGLNPIRPDQCLRHYIKHERTVLQSAPFTTTFNDGEGDFYNIEGARASTGAWNNLSDQSILPTWRFLFDKQVVANNNTTISHDEPVFTGGSSLLIHLVNTASEGQTTIDLFRTNIKLTATNLIRMVVGRTGVDPTIRLWRNSKEPVQVSPSKNKVLDQNWIAFEFSIPAQYAGDLVNQIDLQLTFLSDPQGTYVVGEFSFLDSAINTPKPLRKEFPGDTQVLDWSDSYNNSSHYRVYGVLDKTPYLLGIVYNSVYRAGYGDSPNRIEADHIFNGKLRNFSSYVVTEVQASRTST